MKLKVMENIKELDLIGLDTVKRKIVPVRTNEVFINLTNQGDSILNAERDYKKGERVKVSISADYGKMQEAVAVKNIGQKILDNLPTKEERDEFKKKFNHIKK